MKNRKDFFPNPQSGSAVRHTENRTFRLRVSARILRLLRNA
ncbi:hypothetical protein IZU25_11505 [Treponema maltophilum]